MSDIKGSKLLKGNWVEAQTISHLDDEIEEGYTTSAKVGRDGHKGLIAPDNILKETVSSTKAIYTPLPPHPRVDGIRLHNLKKEALFAMHDAVVGEEQAHYTKAIEATDYTTTNAFNAAQHPVSAEIVHSTTQHHNVNTDQAATFWGQQLGGAGMPGLSSVDDGANPYRRNAKFSTPLHLRNDITTA